LLIASASGDVTRCLALLDTGAEISLFDESLAVGLGIELSSLTSVSISGVGGLARDAGLTQVTVQLLEQPELAVTLEVAFAPDVENTLGNLLGLDILEHFDFGLSHGKRTGYIGRRE
jgi:Retroviral aspartyl protease